MCHFLLEAAWYLNFWTEHRIVNGFYGILVKLSYELATKSYFPGNFFATQVFKQPFFNDLHIFYPCTVGNYWFDTEKLHVRISFIQVFWCMYIIWFTSCSSSLSLKSTLVYMYFPPVHQLLKSPLGVLEARKIYACNNVFIDFLRLFTLSE